MNKEEHTERCLCVFEEYNVGIEAIESMVDMGHIEPSWVHLTNEFFLRLGFAAEDGESIYFLDPTDFVDTPSFSMVTLTSQNYPEGTTWDKIIRDPSFAVSFAEASLMVFKPISEVSPLSRGIVMLHEARHTWRRLAKLATNDPVAEEVEVTLGDISLMRTLLGSTFQEAVQNLMRGFQPTHEGFNAYFTADRHPDWDESLLESVFGPELSLADYQIRYRPIMHAALCESFKMFDSNNWKKLYYLLIEARIKSMPETTIHMRS